MVARCGARLFIRGCGFEPHAAHKRWSLQAAPSVDCVLCSDVCEARRRAFSAEVRPVLESNQVLRWSILAEVGADFEVGGYGRLFGQSPSAPERVDNAVASRRR